MCTAKHTFLDWYKAKNIVLFVFMIIAKGIPLIVAMIVPYLNTFSRTCQQLQRRVLGNDNNFKGLYSVVPR